MRDIDSVAFVVRLVCVENVKNVKMYEQSLSSSSSWCMSYMSYLSVVDCRLSYFVCMYISTCCV